MRTLLTGLAALTLSAVGCKESSDYDDRAPSSQKMVEEAQHESAEAYDRAKEAQENAADEAREAARAEEKVLEAREELQEAESKAAASQQEAAAAQELAAREGEAAHAEAQQAQARASQAQQRAIEESNIEMNADRHVDMDVEGVETVDGPDVNRAEVDRLQSQINSAISRVVHGTERGVESLDDRLDRYVD